MLFTFIPSVLWIYQTDFSWNSVSFKFDISLFLKWFDVFAWMRRYSIFSCCFFYSFFQSLFIIFFIHIFGFFSFFYLPLPIFFMGFSPIYILMTSRLALISIYKIFFLIFPELCQLSFHGFPFPSILFNNCSNFHFFSFTLLWNRRHCLKRFFSSYFFTLCRSSDCYTF